MLVFLLIHLKSSVVLAHKFIVRVLSMSNSFISITYKNKIRLHNECHIYEKKIMSIFVYHGDLF